MTKKDRRDKIDVLCRTVQNTLAEIKLEYEILASSPDTDEAYERGLNDAWDLAIKIELPVKNGGFTPRELCDIFGDESPDEIFSKLTASEALTKVHEYEERQKAEAESATIKLWDELALTTDENVKLIVTAVSEDGTVYGVLSKNFPAFDMKAGQLLYDVDLSEWHKTGRNFSETANLFRTIFGGG